MFLRLRSGLRVCIAAISSRAECVFDCSYLWFCRNRTFWFSRCRLTFPRSASLAGEIPPRVSCESVSARAMHFLRINFSVRAPHHIDILRVIHLGRVSFRPLPIPVICIMRTRVPLERLRGTYRLNVFAILCQRTRVRTLCLLHTYLTYDISIIRNNYRYNETDIIFMLIYYVLLLLMLLIVE